MSRLMVRLHRKQDCFGVCREDRLVSAAGFAEGGGDGLWILQSQDGFGL